MTRYLWLVLAFWVVILPARAESRGISGKKAPVVLPVNGHRGPVNVLLYDHRGHILSAGADGFLGVWDVSAQAAVEHFQLSPFSLTAMILRPDKPEIALIERDDPGFYRVSAWNYETKQKLFVRSFKEPVSYINFSGGGNFLILVQETKTGAFLINAETGEDIPSPLNVGGMITFAATGKSERTMITYESSGFLSYWELESGEEIRRLPVPSNISSPILLGNNNFFAGFDSSGLVILNALSGAVVLRDSSVSSGLLAAEVSDAWEFLCFSGSGVSYFSLTARGSPELTRLAAVSVPEGITSAASAGKIPVLGSADGKVWSVDQRGRIRVLDAALQLPLRDTAVSGGVLAFIGDSGGVLGGGASGSFGVLPLDYTAFKNKGTLWLEGAGNYTRITAAPERNPHGPGRFLLWRSEGDGDIPASPIKNIPVPVMDRDVSGISKEADGTGNLPALQPGGKLLSVSLLGERVLFLDSRGNITITSLNTEPNRYSLFFPGALDAAFLDEENIIIGRSTGSGGSPFVKLNIRDGETVALDYPSAVGIRVYRSAEGAIYGGLALLDSGNVKTAIAKLDISMPDRSVLLMEYPGEDADFDMAEANDTLASTLGEEGAFMYRAGGPVPFERNPGLPVRLFTGINCFLAIDQDGTITWHDVESGKRLALLRLYERQWFLEKADGSRLSGPMRRGGAVSG
ncbi:MAG: WD40 repeat domain-containing protein [Spirochaetaceae bacterium]|nr:WD40 repeat domain-containing protein [Spirochaetaceae bacterium]